MELFYPRHPLVQQFVREIDGSSTAIGTTGPVAQVAFHGKFSTRAVSASVCINDLTPSRCAVELNAFCLSVDEVAPVQRGPDHSVHLCYTTHAPGFPRILVMPQTLLSKLQSPRAEHPLESEGLRVLWWMNVAMVGFLAVLFRMWDLGTLPGVNGDEAWYGMITGELLSGESSSWVTPTGNMLNPFYFGPLLFLHSLFGPSFTILRVPAVVSGLAALVANVACCRKLFGERTALISTMVLAVLPVNIAYSRFGWDTSQTLLATVFLLYACAALARCGFDIEKSEQVTGRKKRRARFQDPHGRRTKFFLLNSAKNSVTEISTFYTSILKMAFH